MVLGRGRGKRMMIAGCRLLSTLTATSDEKHAFAFDDRKGLFSCATDSYR